MHAKAQLVASGIDLQLVTGQHALANLQLVDQVQLTATQHISARYAGDAAVGLQGVEAYLCSAEEVHSIHQPRQVEVYLSAFEPIQRCLADLQAIQACWLVLRLLADGAQFAAEHLRAGGNVIAGQARDRQLRFTPGVVGAGKEQAQRLIGSAQGIGVDAPGVV